MGGVHSHSSVAASPQTRMRLIKITLFLSFHKYRILLDYTYRGTLSESVSLLRSNVPIVIIIIITMQKIKIGPSVRDSVIKRRGKSTFASRKDGKMRSMEVNRRPTTADKNERRDLNSIIRCSRLDGDDKARSSTTT